MEVVAAGFLLNEFHKDKVEARRRRRHGRPHKHDRPQSHSQSHSQSRPPRLDSHGPSNLAPPARPHRPSSAPPHNVYRPGSWQKPQQIQYQQPPPHYQQHLSNLGPEPPWQHRPHFQSQPNAQYPQPGPGALQHPSTFHGSQQHLPRPYVQSSNTFPAQPQQQALNPQSQGHVYIDSKTGKISHNLYPPDHPMARGNDQGPGELYGDGRYNRSMTGDANTGLMWNEKDQNDLAYGKDYSDRRRR